MSRRARTAMGVIGAATALIALAWVDWRPSPAAAREPRLVVRSAGESMHVGAARIDITPPLPHVVAGYPMPRPEALTTTTRLFARALVLLQPPGDGIRKAGFGWVSLEVLEVPPALAAAARAHGRSRGLDEVIVAATHTHKSLGHYDENLLAQVAALGRYDAQVAQRLEQQIARALDEAIAAARPAHCRAGAGSAPGISRNRAEVAAGVDESVHTLIFETEQGALAAGAIVFGAHPTLVPREQPVLDGDFPGRTMALLEGTEPSSAWLFFQGALGDVRAVHDSAATPGAADAASAVAARLATAATSARLGRPRMIDGVQRPSPWALATAALDLPPARAPDSVPAILRRPVANLLSTSMPRDARVTALRLGDRHFVMLPGEPTVPAAAFIRAAIRSPTGIDPVIVGLTSGYLGYLETPERLSAGLGESRRALYGEALWPGLLAAAQRAVEATVQATGK